MKRSSIYISIFIVAGIIYAASCAKQGSPAGGPKDTTPPVVIKSSPMNGSTLFTGKTITLTFDEFVVLDKIQEKFMISPPVEKRPEIVIRGKNVIVTIEGELRDSTTYTLYFQDAIRDLNEANILENFQFVFSTGDYIDSLTMAGLVYDGFNLEVPQRMLIMLHSNHADSAPMTLIPDYISMTGQTGYFTLNNLRAGTYRLFALEDSNNDRKYNPGEELFAFIDEPVIITVEANKPEDHDHIHDFEEEKEEVEVPVTDTTEVHVHLREPDHIMYAFKTPAEKYYLGSSARKQARLLEYFFPLSLDTLEFRFSATDITDEEYFTEVSRNRDTFRIWIKDSTVYNNPTIETVVTYPFTDQEGLNVYKTDTIPLRFVQPRTPRGQVRARGLGIQVNAPRSGIPPARDIRIVPESPLESVNEAQISITISGDSTGLHQPFTVQFDPLVPREAIIKQTLEEDREYQLKFYPGALVSIYGETNDTTIIQIRVRAKSTFGTFTVNLLGYEGMALVQLLDSRESMILERKVVSPGKALFQFVENGNYRLKVIYDEDGNGVWTPGDFLKGRQPEKVSYFPEVIEIKSNWDLEQDWNIENMNVKSDSLRAKVVQRR
jgi:uncharacterized protein (DUF2141 family)